MNKCETEKRFRQQLALNETYKTESSIADLKETLRSNALQNGLDEVDASLFVLDTIKRLLVNCINYIQEGKTSYSNEAIEKIEEMSK